MTDSTTRQTRAPLDLSRKLAGLILVCIIALVWAAKEVLYPIVLACLLALLVVPVVRALERARIPRFLASAGTVLVSSMIIGGLAGFVLNQLTGILQDMPKYEQNIHRRMDEFRGSGSGLLHATGSTLDALRHEITLEASRSSETPAKPDKQDKPNQVDKQSDPDKPSEQNKVSEQDKPTGQDKSASQDKPAGQDKPNAQDKPREQEKPPVPVAIVPSTQSSVADAVGVVLAILSPVLTVGMIVLFAIFMLTQRDDLHERLLAVGHRMARKDGSALTAEALDEATTRISRYLFMQSLANLSTGVCVAIALWLIGVPHPFFWGLMTFLLRYIPYIGMLITGLILAFFTVAVSPDWHMTILTVCVFFGLEMLMSNAIEPFLFGHGTGLSSFAIIVAASFWTWVWGPVGLFVSVPLTVCLVVVGRYVPSMDFLEIILAAKPPRARRS